jgi:hypothetical protein
MSDEGVKWFKSHAPEFVEITAETDPSEIELLVDGNYVRAKLNSSKQSDVEESRQYLLDCRAKGVVVIANRTEPTAGRDGATAIKAGATLEASVGDFIKSQSYPNPEALAVLCNEILAEAKGA